MDDGIESTLTTFFGNIKLGGKADTSEGGDILKKDLNRQLSALAKTV